MQGASFHKPVASNQQDLPGKRWFEFHGRSGVDAGEGGAKLFHSAAHKQLAHVLPERLDKTGRQVDNVIKSKTRELQSA